MKKYKINKANVVQILSNRSIIFDGEKSLLYTFNETASFIIQRIKSGWDENKISIAIARKYNLTVEKAQEDVKKMIKELMRYRIIHAYK